MSQLFCKISESFSEAMIASPEKYTGNVFKVYHFLCRDAFRCGGLTTISYEKLCKLTGLTKPTLSKAIRFLCSEGWIQQKKKIGQVAMYTIFESLNESARFREEQKAIAEKKRKEKENRKLEKQERARKEQERKEHEQWLATATEQEQMMMERFNQTQKIYYQSKQNSPRNNQLTSFRDLLN
jgi:hypothetical protein